MFTTMVRFLRVNQSSTSATQNRRPKRSALGFEQLESRTVPSVAGESIEMLHEINSDIVKTGPVAGSWITKFVGYEGYGPTQLEQIQHDLRDFGSDLTAIRWLGADGLFEMQGDPNLSSFEADRSLKGFSGFVSVEQNFFVTKATTPNDTLYASQTNMAKINAPSAWDINTGVNPATSATRNVVAVLDSGINYNHPDLAGNMWKNLGEIPGDKLDNDGNGYVDDYYGYDFANNDSDPMDDDTNSHGTHVAGIIGAVGNNSLGVSGVAWKSQLMAVKIINASGTGTIAEGVNGVNYVNMMKSTNRANVRVINMSVGSFGSFGWNEPASVHQTAFPTLKSAIELAGNNQILFVAAAGNASNNSSKLGIDNDTGNVYGLGPYYAREFFYPAKFDLANIIVVANTTNTDGLASDSTYGATTTDLGAPGQDVLSTTTRLVGTTWERYSGTSVAAPHVAGTAALMFTMYDKGTVENIKADLMSSVDAATALAGKTVTGGRLNAGNAVLRTSNRAYVEKLYTDVLNRPVDPSGFNTWFGQLNAGATRTTVATSIYYSNERINNFIQGLFNGYLGRVASAGDIDSWRNAYQGSGPVIPMTIERLRANFLASAEFYNRAGGTQYFWISALYTYGLGRTSPDSAGVNWWINRMNTYGLTNLQVAEEFMFAEEAQKTTIKSYYKKLSTFVPGYNVDFLTTQQNPSFLKRIGDPLQQDIDNWYNYKISQNLRAETLAILFLIETEYFNRVV